MIYFSKYFQSQDLDLVQIYMTDRPKLGALLKFVYEKYLAVRNFGIGLLPMLTESRLILLGVETVTTPQELGQGVTTQGDAISLRTHNSRGQSTECRDSCLGVLGVEAF